MATYKRILAPVDFSAGADQGLAHAIDLANTFDAGLHVVHVSEREDEATLDLPIMEGLFSMAQKTLSNSNQQKNQNKTGNTGPVRYAVRGHRDVTRGILDYIADYSIDLLVLSPYGHRRDGHFYFGRTAERLVRLAPCDVLTTSRLFKYEPGHWRRILVPIDFSPASSLALERARRMAQFSAGHLTALYVESGSAYPARDASVRADDDGSAIVDDMVRLYRYASGPDVPHNFAVEQGSPAVRIASYVVRQGIDLVVQASSGRSMPASTTLDIVAESVIKEAVCPVLTVRPSHVPESREKDARSDFRVVRMHKPTREYAVSSSGRLR